MPSSDAATGGEPGERQWQQPEPDEPDWPGSNMERRSVHHLGFPKTSGSAGWVVISNRGQACHANQLFVQAEQSLAPAAGCQGPSRACGLEVRPRPKKLLERFIDSQMSYAPSAAGLCASLQLTLSLLCESCLFAGWAQTPAMRMEARAPLRSGSSSRSYPSRLVKHDHRSSQRSLP